MKKVEISDLKYLDYSTQNSNIKIQQVKSRSQVSEIPKYFLLYEENQHFHDQFEAGVVIQNEIKNER